ncbi:MAG: hypothetical protein SNJ71_08795 [Bacteroidales bacterium]
MKKILSLTLFLIIFICNLNAQDTLLIGKNLFYKKDSIGNVSCASCHRKETLSDSLYFFPTLYDIAKKTVNKSDSEFEEIIFYPTSSDLIMQCHENLAVADTELVYIQTYLKHLATKSEPQK